MIPARRHRPEPGWSPRRLNRLAAGIQARWYLEVGVADGATFTAVNVAARTGVDPHPLLPERAVRPDDELFTGTSNAYFASLPVDRVFDLVYIDGQHTFEQVYRDLLNVLLHTHHGSAILLDDTRPSDVFSTIRDPRQAHAARAAAGSDDRSWHGDAFKVVFAVHDFHLGLEFASITGSGNVQTLLWRAAGIERKPRFDSLETISRLSYFDLTDHEDVLRAVPEDEAIGRCVAALRE